MPPLIDRTGKRFGRLVVLEKHGRKNGSVMWLCKCDCGEKVSVRGYALQNGNTKSCGCLRVDTMRRFGRDNPNWKGDSALPQTGRNRASRWFGSKGKCEKCGNIAHDIHHRDGSTLNNSSDNVIRLCRKCHMEEDGRMKNFVSIERDYMIRGEDGRFVPHEADGREI
jgi:hypothetical protein